MKGTIATPVDEIYFGNFAGPSLYYAYLFLYSSEDTTITGTIIDGTDTYVFDNVSVEDGWSWVKTTTPDGEYFTYSVGEISGAMWLDFHN